MNISKYWTAYQVQAMFLSGFSLIAYFAPEDTHKAAEAEVSSICLVSEAVVDEHQGVSTQQCGYVIHLWGPMIPMQSDQPELT